MSQLDDLIRVEHYIIALGASDLSSGGFFESIIHAAAIAGRKFPLASAVVQTIPYPTPGNKGLVVFLLSGVMVKQGVRGSQAFDLARDGFAYWQDHYCPKCGGTGVINWQQDECRECRGAKNLPRPDRIARAVQAIDADLQDFERELRLQMRNWVRNTINPMRMVSPTDANPTYSRVPQLGGRTKWEYSADSAFDT